MNSETDCKIEIRDLTMAYGSFVVMRDVNVKIKRGEICIIMGGSGCGKSTLLRQMIGLKQPALGDVYYDGVAFWKSDGRRGPKSCEALACRSRAARSGVR